MPVTGSVLNSASVSVSNMTEHDLLEVVEIEQSCGLSRWGWDAYHTELQSDHRDLMLVARVSAADNQDETTIAGYLVARLTAGELHLNNLAVRQSYRRRGVGTALLGRISEAAKRAGAFTAFLEVRAGNSAAKAFYEHSGFVVVGRRRQYYSAPAEDALIMSLQLLLNA
jgi:ribosomal-protein-alanine N-acetyltransferase